MNVIFKKAIYEENWSLFGASGHRRYNLGQRLILERGMFNTDTWRLARVLAA